jgi:ABC-type multidrug transport system ATPase subunit
MDEPSMGLSPVYVEQVFDIIQTINRQGTTIFMVEQNANMALAIADRAYVLQTGQIILSGPPRIARKRDDPPRLSWRAQSRLDPRCTLWAPPLASVVDETYELLPRTTTRPTEVPWEVALRAPVQGLTLIAAARR